MRAILLALVLFLFQVNKLKGAFLKNFDNQSPDPDDFSVNWMERANPFIVKKILGSAEALKEKLNQSVFGSENTIDEALGKPKAIGTLFDKHQAFHLKSETTSDIFLIDPLRKELESISLEEENNKSRTTQEDLKNTVRLNEIEDKYSGKRPTIFPTASTKQDADENEEFFQDVKKGAQESSIVNEKDGIIIENSEVDPKWLLKEQMLLQNLPDNTFEYSFSEVYTLVYISILIVVVFLMINLRDRLNNKLNENLTNTLNCILRDIIILITSCTLIQLFNYGGLFSSGLKKQIDIDGICIDLAVFSLLWLFLGTYHVFVSQSFIKQWKSIEYLIPKRLEIYQKFETIHVMKEEGKLTKDKALEMEDYRRQLEYFLMRQDFIAPSFLPTVTENFLRDDFDFVNYLAKAMAKTSKRTFKMSISSLIIVMLVSLAWFCLEQATEHVQIWLMMCVPLLVTILLGFLLQTMKKIYARLVHIVNTPYEIKFMEFERVRQPLINIDKIRYPDYLNGKLVHADGRAERSIPNKHESIFWFSSCQFHIRCLHFTLIIQIVWLITFFTHYYRETTPAIYVMLAFVIASIFINIFYLMPKNLYYLCISTNIQMMKDQKLINQVIEESRNYHTLVFAKLYQLLKSTRKQMDDRGRRGTPLREFIVKQVKEAFESLEEEKDSMLDSERVKLISLINLSHLLGKDFEEDELIFFARECSKDNLHYNLENLLETIEKYTEDVQLEPSECSREVLQKMIKRVFKKKEEYVSLRELKELLLEHKIIQSSELDALLHEVRYLHMNNQEVTVQCLSNLIRNRIEGLPR